jgi:hypothetical protein
VLGPRERERGVELTDSSVGSRSFFVGKRCVPKKRKCVQEGRKEGRKDVNGGAEIYLCLWVFLWQL